MEHGGPSIPKVSKEHFHPETWVQRISFIFSFMCVCLCVCACVCEKIINYISFKFTDLYVLCCIRCLNLLCYHTCVLEFQIAVVDGEITCMRHHFTFCHCIPPYDHVQVIITDLSHFSQYNNQSMSTLVSQSINIIFCSEFGVPYKL
jgi:hypothetical protein